MNDGIHAVLFDFGGVLADEGFRNGLHHIAGMNGLEPETFFETARDLIASCGYLTGRATEADYFGQLRRMTGIAQDDAELRRITLEGFVLRGWMMAIVDSLRTRGVRVAILSDQTDWLDELDARLRFSARFERVYNSYHLGISKHDPQLFRDVAAWMGLESSRALFIDDTAGHVERAIDAGMHAIHYRGRQLFLQEMDGFFPGLTQAP